MSALQNPFVLFGYAGKTYFCDRETETNELISALQNGRNVTLRSPRRVGKTGLIHHVFDQLAQSNPEIKCFYVDLFATHSLDEMVTELGKAVIGQLDTPMQKAENYVVKFFQSCRLYFSTDPLTGSPKLGLDLVTDNPAVTLDEIFSYICRSERECYIAIDEFQQILEYPEKNVEALLRTFIQNISNANFVFAGSQRRLMEEMFFSEKRPFFMSARSIVLEAIPFDVYCDFVCHHFEQAGKAIERDAIRLVYDAFQGVTLYLQRIMKDAFIITPAGDTCNTENTRHLVDEYILECEPRLREQLAMITEPQKELLYAMSEEGGPVKSITSAAFIKRHRMKSSSAVQSASKKLLEYDLLTRREGFYQITDPLLALWLKSRKL